MTAPAIFLWKKKPRQAPISALSLSVGGWTAAEVKGSETQQMMRDRIRA